MGEAADNLVHGDQTPDDTVPKPLYIVIPVDIRPFTKNNIVWKIKNKWSCRDYQAKHKRAKELARCEWIREGQPTIHGRVLVNVHVVRSTGEELDEPNIWWGMAGFIDGLFTKGITPDDKPKYLKCGEITQDSHPRHKRREHIRIEIVPLDPDSKGLF